MLLNKLLYIINLLFENNIFLTFICNSNLTQSIKRFMFYSFLQRMTYSLHFSHNLYYLIKLLI
ncbi:hypothetical protein CNEO4_2600004 [Clostridium neonatale]|nr:hypothetical protein CNEO3_1360004 [Clostridium neonatale]CAI3613214.1 hypothetical protein CNEO2_1480004 [Clostridium neonatale]CAI3666952.1 hypothetical protein CNEO4_2600004 [Clostridium neonatale]